jgi:hypothetical protein
VSGCDPKTRQSATVPSETPLANSLEITETDALSTKAGRPTIAIPQGLVAELRRWKLACLRQ